MMILTIAFIQVFRFAIWKRGSSSGVEWWYLRNITVNNNSGQGNATKLKFRLSMYIQLAKVTFIVFVGIKNL